jgi:hypothetical protein
MHDDASDEVLFHVEEVNEAEPQFRFIRVCPSQNLTQAARA